MVQCWILHHIYQLLVELIKTQSHRFIHLILIFSKDSFIIFRLFLYISFSYQAATLAVLATERFFNDLRKELGDENFDRLFAIHPTTEDSHSVSKGIAHLRNFQFFTPSISSGFNIGLHLFRNIKQTAKDRWNKIKWMVHHEKSNEIPIEDISFRRKRAFNL